MAKILFFFTSSYPFGTGETFIENEIDYLAEAFDKIVIVSNDISSRQTRTIPLSCATERFSYELRKTEKIRSLKNVFHSLYKQECLFIKRIYRLNISTTIRNTACQTLQKGIVWQHRIGEIIRRHSSPTDHIYLYSYWNNDTAFALAYYKRKHPNVNAFSRMHRWDVYFEEAQCNYLPFRKYIFDNIDHAYSISEDGVQYTQYKLQIPSLKIGISRLGVKQRAFFPYEEKRRLHILSISNLIPVKAIDKLINALGLINIDFFWTHIGDGPERCNLEDLAMQKIEGKYVFKGHLQNHSVVNYLNSNYTDLFVNVSSSEGIPVSIMEAMSVGVPCLATDVGGTHEIVDQSNGLLLPADLSPDFLAEKISWFHNLPQGEKIKMRESAYKTWKEKFDAETNYRAFANEIMNIKVQS